MRTSRRTAALGREAADLERRGAMREALEAWRRALEGDPRSADLRYRLAEALIDAFEPRAALEAAAAGEADWPEDPRFPLVRADALLHRVALEDLQGEERRSALEEARVALRRAARLRRLRGVEDGELCVVEAQALLLAGERRRAEGRFRAALEKGLPLVVDRLEVLLNLGLLALGEGRPQEARHCFARLRRILGRWRQQHYHRLIPFREYLWLIERAFLGEDRPLPRDRHPGGLRDKEIYRAIRNGCRALREALARDDRAALGEAAKGLRTAMEQRPLAACLQFVALKKPFLLEALDRLEGRITPP